MRKTPKHDITHAVSMIMIYKNSKILVFKVLGVVVYSLIDKYLCVDYFCLQREENLSSLQRVFEETSFNKLSEIGISEILLNIFIVLWLYSRWKLNTDIDVQKKIGVILPIKRFCDNWKTSQAFEKVPLIVQNCMHASNMYDSVSIMSFSTLIPSVKNTLMNISLGEPLWCEFTSE